MMYVAVPRDMVKVKSRNRFSTAKGMVYEFLHETFDNTPVKKGDTVEIDGEKLKVIDIEMPHAWPGARQYVYFLTNNQ